MPRRWNGSGQLIEALRKFHHSPLSVNPQALRRALKLVENPQITALQRRCGGLVRQGVGNGLDQRARRVLVIES
jgi:hypothetical protein